jgi:hypothetical protein
MSQPSAIKMTEESLFSRPSISNDAVESALPLNIPPKTPSSQQSDRTFFDPEIWDNTTPIDNDEPFSPITPLSVSAEEASHQYQDGYSSGSDKTKEPQVKSERLQGGHPWLRKSWANDGADGPRYLEEDGRTMSKFISADYENISLPKTPSKSPQVATVNFLEGKKEEIDVTLPLEVFSPIATPILNAVPKEKISTSQEFIHNVENNAVQAKVAYGNSGKIKTEDENTVLIKAEYEISNATQNDQIPQQMANGMSQTSRKEFKQYGTRARTTVLGINLFKIIPHNVKERFQEDPNTCCASLVRKQVRCKKKFSDRSTRIQFHLEILSAPDLFSNMPGALSGIEGLFNSAFCGAHINVATKHFGKLRKIEDIWTKNLDVSALKTNCIDDRAIISKWIQTLTGAVSYVEENTKSRKVNGAIFNGKPADINFSGAGHTHKSSRPSLPPMLNFEPYIAKQNEKYTINELLLLKMIEPLSPREEITGNLYVYWNVGEFGHVKIGTTRFTVDYRLNSWYKQCKKDVQELKIGEESIMKDIPHVYRVEKLIHTELAKCRVRVPKCAGCHKGHREWFEITKITKMAETTETTSKFVQRLILKWVKWIRKSPYKKVSENNIRLDQEMIRRARKIGPSTAKEVIKHESNLEASHE